MSSMNRYPANPLDGNAQMAEWIREIERRIAGLEGRSGFAASLKSLDPSSGTNPVTVGLLSNGAYGIEVVNAAGQVLFHVDATNGQTDPHPAIAMMPDGLVSGLTNGWRPGTSSGTLVPLWRGIFTTIGPYVDYDFGVFPNGNSMTYEVYAYETGVTPVAVLGPTTTSTNTSHVTGTLTIPSTALASGDDVAGREMHLEWHARMNSGSGTVDIAMRTPPINHA